MLPLPLLDLTLARALADSVPEADHLVDDAEMPRVVDEAPVGSDLGVDAAPELDVGLEFGGARKRLTRIRRRAVGDRSKKRECCGGDQQ